MRTTARFLTSSLALLAASLLHPQGAQAQQGVRGDVDGDGRVTAADARLVMDFLAGRALPSGVSVLPGGDADGNGRITGVDAAIINGYAAGRDMSRYPVGRGVAPGEGDGLAMLLCQGSVQTRTVSCRAPGGVPGGANADVIVGGQNLYVTLASNDVQVVADTFMFDVTVTNLVVQPMGLDSAGGVDGNGVRIFFHSGPVATLGVMEVVNQDGDGTFTGGMQPFFAYTDPLLGGDGMLATGETSGEKTWKLTFTEESSSFTFQLYVSAPFEYPRGWVDLYPRGSTPIGPEAVPVDTLRVGEPRQLEDTVRTAVGTAIPGQSVTWSSTGPAITVDGTGLVTGAAIGLDSAVAETSSPLRRGKVLFQVVDLDTDSTEIEASPTTVTAGDTSTVMIQLRDNLGRTYPLGGQTVVFFSDHGTLSGQTDHANGTHSAKLTWDSTGVVIAGAVVNGDTVADSVSVVFQAGAPATLERNSADPQSAEVTTAVAEPPSVIAKDGLGNPVAGVVVVFAVTGGGGQISDGGAGTDSVEVTTNIGGIATLASWTMGTGAGTDNNMVEASTGALTPLTFTASATAGAAAGMALHAGGAQTDTVGQVVPVAPAVIITDANGNPVPGVSVAFTPTADGQVTGSPATTDAGGIATLGSWQLRTSVGVDSVVASSAGLTDVAITATAVADAPATMTRVSAESQTSEVGTAVAEPPTVHLADVHGNDVAGASVTFTVGSGGGSVDNGVTSGSSVSVTTDAAGQAALSSWTLGTGAGTDNNGVTASHTGLTDVGFTASATPGAVAELVKISAAVVDTVNPGGSVTTKPRVRAEDQYDNPVPGTAITFTPDAGSSVAGGSPTADASGEAEVGSWTLNTDGARTLTVSAGAAPTVQFTGYVNFAPVAARDSIDGLGNVTITASGMLGNDTDTEGEALTVTPVSGPTAGGGTITIDATGAVTSYVSSPTFTGLDSIGYTISDPRGRTATGRLVIRIPRRMWFVQGGAAGTGTQASPAGSLATVNAPSAIGDSIFLLASGSAAAGGTLKNNQVLVGAGLSGGSITRAFGGSANLTIPTVTLLPAGLAPQIGAITLGSGNTMRGLRVANGAGGGVIGASVGTFSFTEGSVGATGGPALDLATGTATIALDSLRSTNSSTTGINLSAVGGSIAIGGGTASSISGPTGSAVSITGAVSPTFSFPGTISKTNAAGTGINIQNLTGGSISFSGPSVVLSTGTGAGVNMTGTAAAVSLSFVDSLRITTTSGNGFNATSGTVSVAGTHNSISSTGGIALNVSNSTIAAGGLSFRSINANGGSSGIVLNNTGSTAGLTVAGTGGTCATTGDAGCTGGVIQSTTGVGISLTNTRNISLSNIEIRNTGFHGVSGTSVSNVTGDTIANSFTIQNSLLHSPGDADNESGLHFDAPGVTNITGRMTVSNVAIRDFEDVGLHVGNVSGQLVINGSSLNFNNNSDANGEEGIDVDASGSAFIRTNISNSRFTDLEGGSMNIVSQGSGSVDMNIDNTTTIGTGGPDNFPTPPAMTFSAEGSLSTMRFDITNNRILDSSGDGIFIGHEGTLEGRITGNQVTGMATGDGLRIDTDITSADSTKILVQNNNFGGLFNFETVNYSGIGDDGIQVLHRDGTKPMSLNIIGNMIANTASEGIRFFADDDVGGGGPDVLLSITGNTFTSIAPTEAIVVVSQDPGTTVCSHIATNTFPAGKNITLQQSSSATLTISQPSTAALTAANTGGPAVSTFGTIGFNGNCAPVSPTNP